MSTLRRRGQTTAEPKRSGHVLSPEEQQDESALSQPLLHADGEPSSPVERSEIEAAGSPTSSSSSNNWSTSVKETAKSVACGFMDLLPSKLQEKFLPIPPIAHIRFLEGWSTHVSIGTPFEKSNPVHEEMLRKFWPLCFEASQRTAPQEPVDLKSEEWKQFGFQGVDPATDFRGGGIFSLQNLLFLAELHPSLFHECSHRADYPFAVAGINMTMIIITVLHLNQKQTCLATRQHNDRYSAAQARANLSKWISNGRSHGAFLSIHERNDDGTRVFHEVYRLGCALVHDEWLKSNRNLMAFNSILNEGTRRLIDILKVCDSLAEAMSHLPSQFR